MRVIIEIHDVELRQGVGRDRRHAQGNRLDAFRPALGGDYDGGQCTGILAGRLRPHDNGRRE